MGNKLIAGYQFFLLSRLRYSGNWEIRPFLTVLRSQSWYTQVAGGVRVQGCTHLVGGVGVGLGLLCLGRVFI